MRVGAVVWNELMVADGVIAVTNTSSISRFVVPPSTERKNLIDPAVVVPVALIETPTMRFPTPLPEAVVGPAAISTVVPDPSRAVFAVVTCETSIVGAVEY